MSYEWLNIIQDCLLPPTCLLCGNDGHDRLDLCQPCYQQLPWNANCCYRCGAILETSLSSPTLCGLCLSSKPAFEQTHAPLIYQGAVQYLITALKFGADFKNARLLGYLLADHLQQHAELPDLIIPVPLHPARYRQRGFNQAIEIARTVAKELRLPVDLTSCRRLRNTTQQASLSAKQRRHNMKQAFAVTKNIHAKHVAIIDDVMTTGSTTRELALALTNSGVARVDVWVCARA